MTAMTVLPFLTLVRIIQTMALGTSIWRLLLEQHLTMAHVTGQIFVLTLEWKAGVYLVVKLDLGPGLFRVADIATITVALEMDVLFFVATETGGFQFVLKNVLLMAVFTN